MNIQIDTKTKTVQFISEFTFKDLEELKGFIPDIKDWKIIPYTKINTVTIKDNWSTDPKNPFKGWQLSTEPWIPGGSVICGTNPATTVNIENAKEIATTFTKDTDKFKNPKAEERRKEFTMKGINREPIEEFTNYDNKPEY